MKYASVLEKSREKIDDKENLAGVELFFSLRCSSREKSAAFDSNGFEPVGSFKGLWCCILDFGTGDNGGVASELSGGIFSDTI